MPPTFGFIGVLIPTIRLVFITPMSTQENNNQKFIQAKIDAIAEQWVNLVFAHLHYKKQNKAKGNKNNNGK